jgi:hypothetical protein
MGPQPLLPRRRQPSGSGPVEGVPVDVGGFEVGQPDPADGDLLPLDGVLGVPVPPVSDRDDDPLGEALLAGRRQKGVDVLLTDGRAGRVELALDRDVAAGEPVDGDQVDARVVLAAAAWPLLPQPDIAELVGVDRIGTQKLRHQLLEFAPLVASDVDRPQSSSSTL